MQIDRDKYDEIVDLREEWFETFGETSSIEFGIGPNQSPLKRNALG
ncbi:MAG: hypothetical protein OXI87_14295 [Albidovulum sp.]|nr:hypothetical protein [Albidovulum sp.]MDE0532606.1 hypothetical protein [Albidovulum sp.]